MSRGSPSGHGGSGFSPRRPFSASSTDYKLLEEVGYGAHAVVYRAIYLPTSEVVAVKCLDLDRCNSNLDDIRREAQTMSLIDHPNIIKAYCSFVVEHNLWVIMPFMAEGSCLHLMKIAFPDGFEEPVICSILKETLKALVYLHKQGHIHRDVKAGNILIDSPGVVKLGDFGVTACMFDKGDRQRSRNTFVGTPCWMAPEVLQPGAGYDFKADIWSFGITALELAHGHAPFSKYPPMKVLLMTLQNAPPGLDYDRDKRFSKSFKELVAMCLVKDQAKRPSADKLLKHSFFKNAKPPELTLKKVIADLPPLWDRVRALQLKDQAQLALKKMPSSEQEALSLSEYKRGVSAWNFDIEDMKSQAALIRDDDSSDIKEEDNNARTGEIYEVPSNHNSGKPESSASIVTSGSNDRANLDIRTSAKDLSHADQSNSSIKRMVQKFENRQIENDSVPSTSKQEVETKQKGEFRQKVQAYSGPLAHSMQSSSMYENDRSGERLEAGSQVLTEKHRNEIKRPTNFSGQLCLPNRASANSLSAPIRSSTGYVDSVGDKSKRNVVEIKGRFSVTSENVDLAKVPEIPIGTFMRRSPQGSPLRKSASVGDWLVNSKSTLINQQIKELCTTSTPASVLVPHLQNLVEQTSLQQDLIINILKNLQQHEAVDASPIAIPSCAPHLGSNEMVETAADRERVLLTKISELQARMITLTDELITVKLKHMQLQQELNELYCREEIEEDIKEEGSEES